MWRITRIACGVAAVVLAALAAVGICAQRRAICAWEREAAVRNVSASAPIEASIADLYRRPPPPGKRVLLQGAVAVRDTIVTGRDVIEADGSTRTYREGLIFLEDPDTGKRLVLLRPLERRGSAWVELMPMPRDVRLPAASARWTPLAHLAGIWLSGWADANGPGALVWLGQDSALIRGRDVAGDPTSTPYALRAAAIAGSPGGPPCPSVVTPGTVVLLLAAAALSVAASRRACEALVGPVASAIGKRRSAQGGT